jgi:predicted nucleic acid-binding protein
LNAVLLDSTVLIDLLNDVDQAAQYLRAVREASAVSVVTRAEVLVGYGDEDRSIALDLLNEFPTLAIDTETADLAAGLRRLHRLKLPDAFQAALAERYGLRLATRNTRDFPEERFPFVLVPYRL